MHKLVVYTLFLVVFIIGCAEPEPETPPPPPPPPPPSAQELASKIIADVKLNDPIPTSTSVISPTVAGNMKTQLQKGLGEISGQVNNENARTIVRMAVDDRISACVDAELWTHVLALIDLHLVIKPDSKKHIANQTRAVIQLKKPVVTIKGVLTDKTTGRKKALLDFFMPLENKTYSESMLVGESMYGLRLEEVIGSDKGIILYYQEADERYEILRDKD